MNPMPGHCTRCASRIWWRAGSWMNHQQGGNDLEHFPCEAS